jgi:hypothetical protein
MTASTSAVLLDLAERCEKASGPDRELDAAIEVVLQLNAPGKLINYIGPFAFDGDNDDGSVTVWAGKQKIARYRPPAFTASLDAAMTLADDNEITTLLNEATERLSTAGWLVGHYRESLILFFAAAALRARAAGGSAS